MERTEEEHMEWFGERAGIAEFDAGMTRAEAEKEAYRLWRDDVGPNVPAPREMQEVVRKARNAKTACYLPSV
jgi:hypothetical protein